MPVLQDDETRIHSIADGRIQTVSPEGLLIIDGSTVQDIAPFEFRFLSHLIDRVDRVVSMEDICMAMWGHYDVSSASNARGLVRKLRGKFGEELGDKTTGAIRTRPGLGYSAVSSLVGFSRPEDEDENEVYSIADGRVEIRPGQSLISDDELIEDITPAQLKIAEVLAVEPDKVKSLPEISWEVSGKDDARASNVVSVQISGLRRPLGPELGDPKKGAFRNVFGLGYYAASSLSKRYDASNPGYTIA